MMILANLIDFTYFSITQKALHMSATDTPEPPPTKAPFQMRGFQGQLHQSWPAKAHNFASNSDLAGLEVGAAGAGELKELLTQMTHVLGVQREEIESLKKVRGYV